MQLGTGRISLDLRPTFFSSTDCPSIARMHTLVRANGRFIRDNSRWLAGGFLLTMFSSFGRRSSSACRAMRSALRFHLSDGAFGGLYMLATLASAATLPWLGRTLDLMPGWKVVRFTV